MLAQGFNREVRSTYAEDVDRKILGSHEAPWADPSPGCGGGYRPVAGPLPRWSSRVGRSWYMISLIAGALLRLVAAVG